MSDDFDALAAALPPRLAAEAYASGALSDAYWRARRAGHGHDALLAQSRALGSADNPVGLLVARLRRLADTPPPQRRAGGSISRGRHRDCPDAHPDCDLCLCDPRASAHHVATPMPDWFRQAWNELRVARTGLMP